MGLAIKWDITYKCNLMCGHCINGHYLNNLEDEINYEEFTRIIENITLTTPIEYIHFLGGEPLTRKDFIEILYYLEQKNIKFGFNTNGLLLNEDLIEKIGEYRFFDTIILSMEGPNAEINDNIRGNNTYNLLMNRMEIIKKYRREHLQSKFKLCINTVLTNLNCNYIMDIIKLCENQAVDELNLLQYIEEGNGEGKKLAMNAEQFLNVIKNIASYYTFGERKVNIVPKFARPLAKKYAEQCLNMDFPDIEHACGAGADTLFIDNKGIIYPCDRSRKYKIAGENLVKEDFMEIWKSDKFSEPFSMYSGDKIFADVIPCNQCEYLHEQCNPCYMNIQNDDVKEASGCRILLEEIKKQNDRRYTNEKYHLSENLRIAERKNGYVILNPAHGDSIEVDKTSKEIIDFIKLENPTMSHIIEYGKSKKIAPKEIQEYIECLKGIDIVYADEK